MDILACYVLYFLLLLHFRFVNQGLQRFAWRAGPAREAGWARWSGSLGARWRRPQGLPGSRRSSRPARTTRSGRSRRSRRIQGQSGARVRASQRTGCGWVRSQGEPEVKVRVSEVSGWGWVRDHDQDEPWSGQVESGVRVRNAVIGRGWVKG